MLKISLKVLGILLIIIITYFVGKANGDPNDKLRYGDSGSPVNCRALIIENQHKYLLQETYGLSAEDALNSIFRNCGELGHLWDR